MKALRPILFLFLVLVAGPSVEGQEVDTEILLGGILLRLGMSQDEAIRTLGAVYELTYMDASPGLWLVNRRGDSALGSIGQVDFADQRLIGVNKEWSPPPSTAEQLASALYDADRCRASSRRIVAVRQTNMPLFHE